MKQTYNINNRIAAGFTTTNKTSLGFPEFLTIGKAAHTVALLGHRQLQHLWVQVRGTAWLVCLPYPAHCCINPARSSLTADHPSSVSPGGQSHLHSCHPANSCPRAKFWEVSPSSGWPFPKKPALCQGSWSIWNYPSQSNLQTLLSSPLSPLGNPLLPRNLTFLNLGLFSRSAALFPSTTSLSAKACQMLSLSLCLFAILLSLPAPWAAGGRAWNQLLWKQLHTHSGLCHRGTCQNLRAISSTDIDGPRNWQEGNVTRNKETRHGQDKPLNPPGSIHLPPWSSQCHAHGCALPACSAQPPLQPPQLNSRLGNPAPSRRRISMVPDNIHCKNLTLLQWEHTNLSLPDLGSAALGLIAFSKQKRKKKKYFALN